MLITHILDDLSRDALVDLFGLSVVMAVESNLTEKVGKPYVQCLVRQKNVQAKREELVRQLWLHRLTQHYKYPAARLMVEYPITFGRDSSKRADIVVFDADRPTVPYLIVEVKQGKFKDGKEQLRSYTHATGAPLAMWCNGVKAITWHRKNPNYFVEIPDIPAAAQTIDDIAGQPWTVETLIEIEKKREAEGKGARSLKQLIEDMEDEVLANAGVDVFEEVFKLIFTKLYDEMYCFRKRHKYLRFRNSNTAAQLKANIQSLFDDARKQWPGVFSEDEKIKLGPEHLQVCIGSLEEWKLFNSNLDVVDEAFEYLVNKSSKGEKGQYFTPRWVIDLCVKMMNPHESETVIDTACGSAGFTVHAIFHVWKQILESEGLPVSHLFTMEDKPQRCKDYVQDKVFAIDFDEKSVRVARCLNLIAGDGQTNVLHLNTLDWPKWEERIQQDDDWRDTYGEGWKKIKKLRAVKNDNRAFRFDVLMANPPFAGDIKQSDMLSPYELGHKTNGKLESKIGRDLLFIERNLDFLRPGGRMAVVLPQGRFNNSSDKRVREFIAERCRILAVVGLHPNTFKPHTGTKTSVLFVQKWNNDGDDLRYHCPKADDYPIFFATQKVESKDTSSEKIIAKDANGELLRDSHGHWIVQHDFFNHDGFTQDGIAEAFAEFAAKENLVFLSRPFDETRYRALLEGLEAAEITFSALERTLRVDAEFFLPKHLRIAAKLMCLNTQPITKIATISDGNHFTISDEFVEKGVPYYRGQDVVGQAFIEQAAPVCITEKAFRQPFMIRSHLKRGDVLLSIIGTIGESSLVSDDTPATCSCKLAILRPCGIAPEYLSMYLRSEYGRSQIERFTRGAVQMGLLLEDMDQIKVARLTPEFEAMIGVVVSCAKKKIEESQQYTEQAEQTLLRALGLENWQPPEPLTYTRSSRDAFAAGRLDAEHFQPKFDAMLSAIRATGLEVVELASTIIPVKNGFDSRVFVENGTPYIRVGDISQCRIKIESAERIAISISEVHKDISLKVGDVLFTRKGSYGNAAPVRLGDENAIISSEIMLIRSKEQWVKRLLPEYLAMFFNCLAGRYQAEKWAHGVAFYSISQDDLNSFYIPIIPIEVQHQIKQSIDVAEDSRRRAAELLNAAKRAVEIAIETDEATALELLNKAIEESTE